MADPASGTLAGITRRSLIEFAAEAGDQVQEGRLSAGDLRRAAEVAITSTAGGIMPVTLVDGQPVGTGTPGPPRCGSGTGPATRTPSSLPRSATTAKAYRHARSIKPRPSPSVMTSAKDNERGAAVRSGSLIIGPVIGAARNGHYERRISSRMPLAARVRRTREFRASGAEYPGCSDELLPGPLPAGAPPGEGVSYWHAACGDR